MSNNELWYNKEALNWYQGLPLGNGKIGAMVRSQNAKDIINLTEISCYSGSVTIDEQAAGANYLQPIQDALSQRDYDLVHQLAKNMTGNRNNYGSNIPVGDIEISLPDYQGQPCEIRRELKLNHGVVTCNRFYNPNRSQIIKSEYFTSNPDQVFVLNYDLPLETSLVLSYKDYTGVGSFKADSDQLIYTGKALEHKHSDGQHGVNYAVNFHVVSNNSRIKVLDDVITIKAQGQVTIYIAINTSYNSKSPELDIPINKVLQKGALDVHSAANKSYTMLRSRHIGDVTKLYNRVTFELDQNGCNDASSTDFISATTDHRLNKFKSSCDDTSLITLMYNYGRYLMIASSRENAPLPAHLQGVWNDDVACSIGWTCDMHLDINTQMLYWPLLSGNLRECMPPLIDWVKNILVPSGRITARNTYGLKGWVAHTISNPWGYTAPGAAIYWGFHVTGGAWIATHLWDYYLYTNDLDYLEETAYPILKECAQFFIEYMFIDERTNYCVTGPSHSPENAFYINNKPYSVDLMPTCDIAILSSLFRACITASELLNLDHSFSITLQKMLSNFPPYQVDDDGKLQEWLEPHTSTDPNHRHTSHLLSLYPFGDISPDKDKAIAKATAMSIQHRMTPAKQWEDTGWARCLLIVYCARLQDSKNSLDHLNSLLSTLTMDNLLAISPPVAGADQIVFELDGNTGFTNGINEMMLQSYQDYIHLLPAKPDEWIKGSIRGLKAIGDYEVCINFDSNTCGYLIKGKSHSKVRIRYKEDYLDIKLGEDGLAKGHFKNTSS